MIKFYLTLLDVILKLFLKHLHIFFSNTFWDVYTTRAYYMQIHSKVNKKRTTSNEEWRLFSIEFIIMGLMKFELPFCVTYITFCILIYKKNILH